MLKKGLPVFIIIFIISCSSTSNVSNNSQDPNSVIDSWKGSTKNELLMEWGAPKSIASDGKGGEILTYEDLKRAKVYNRGYITVIHRTMFYVNAKNIIYHALYQRDAREGL